MNDPVTGWPLIEWSYEGSKHGRHDYSICAHERGEVDLDRGGHACVLTVQGRSEDEVRIRVDWLMKILLSSKAQKALSASRAHRSRKRKAPAKPFGSRGRPSLT